MKPARVKNAAIVAAVAVVVVTVAAADAVDAAVEIVVTAEIVAVDALIRADRFLFLTGGGLLNFRLFHLLI